MKKILARVVLSIASIGLIVALGVLILLDRQAWRCGRRLSGALQTAQKVTLVEYTGDKEIARKAATAEEIRQLRRALSSWWHPFVPPSVTLSFVPHHRIEVVQSGGSRVTALISFVCDQFLIDDETTAAPLPPRLHKSLRSVFSSGGMTPKTDDQYRALGDPEDGSN
jgi:hypothetical protein